MFSTHAACCRPRYRKQIPHSRQLIGDKSHKQDSKHYMRSSARQQSTKMNLVDAPRYRQSNYQGSHGLAANYRGSQLYDKAPHAQPLGLYCACPPGLGRFKGGKVPIHTQDTNTDTCTQEHRHADTQRPRQTHRQTDKQTNRRTDTQTHRHTHTQKLTHARTDGKQTQGNKHKPRSRQRCSQLRTVLQWPALCAPVRSPVGVKRVKVKSPTTPA